MYESNSELWYPPVSNAPKPLSCWVSKCVSQTKRPSSCVELTQLNVCSSPGSPIQRSTQPQPSPAVSSTVSSSCTRAKSQSPILTAQRKVADALTSTCRRQILHRIIPPDCLVSPYQEPLSPDAPMYLYLFHFPRPELLARLAGVGEQCFPQTVEQTIGLLFSKRISDSDYVCRLPLYLKNGMARVRVRLAGEVRLSARDLALVVAGHRVLAGLTVDIAHSSSGGLCQVLSSSGTGSGTDDRGAKSTALSAGGRRSVAGSPPPPLGNPAADLPWAFRQLVFSPEKSNMFGITAIVSFPEKAIDLAATQAIIDWETTRLRFMKYRSPTPPPAQSPLARNHQHQQGLTRSIMKQHPTVLGQLAPSFWPGRVVRPCCLPDRDSGVFAVLKCDTSTGNSPVPESLAQEVQQRLNADAPMAPKLLTGTPRLSVCDYCAIIYPKIEQILDRIDPSLPLAVCCRLTRHKNAAQVTAGMKANSNCSVGGSVNHNFSYLADTCAVYPLSAWQWFLLSLLPTALHQFTRALLSLEFAQLLAGKLRGRRLASSTVLIPDRLDAPVCALSDLFEKTSMDIHVQEQTSLDDLGLDRQATGLSHPVDGLRLPEPRGLLEAITLLSAKDAVNLERLEWLGDSLLQLINSLTVYTDLPSGADEGILTRFRIRMVCNFNLCRLAVAHGWVKYCMGRMFSPKDHYLPPCFTVPNATNNNNVDNCDQRLYVELTEKSLADMVEALIGYFLTSTDLPTALSLLSYLGLSSVNPKPVESTGEQRAEADKPTWSRLFFGEDTSDCPAGPRSQLKQRQRLNADQQHCLSVFSPKSTGLSLSPFDAAKQVDRATKQGMRQLEAALDGLQTILGYRFNDTRHLVEALSPPASPCSSLFGSYQRLEFLGDAVLGHVVSIYLYTKCPGYKPGDLTEARSNFVKNDTLALSVVEQKMHHFILCSPETIQHAVSTIQTIQDKESSYSKQLELLCGEVLQGLKVKVIADIFEALIGAIFVDTNGSLSIATRVIHRLLDKRMASYLEHPPINILQKLHLLFPDLRYEESYSEAVTGCKYILKASVSGKDIITTGMSRNEARLDLAKRLDVSECLKFST